MHQRQKIRKNRKQHSRICTRQQLCQQYLQNCRSGASRNGPKEANKSNEEQKKQNFADVFTRGFKKTLSNGLAAGALAVMKEDKASVSSAKPTADSEPTGFAPTFKGERGERGGH